MQLRGGNHLMQGKIVGSWLGMVALHWGEGEWTMVPTALRGLCYLKE